MQHLPILEEAVRKHPHPLVFATISGAHLYGFASPDSDYDLRGVHVLPIEALISLKPSDQETIESMKIENGIELDLVTHDVKKFFSLLLKRNGYVLEQLYSPLVVHTSTYHQELKQIAGECITRYHSHHYLGFANTQWKLFANENPPRVKPLLYVYRVLLTGINLMQSGRIEANLGILNQLFALPYIPELIDRKQLGHEHERLSTVDADFHKREYERLCEILKEEAEKSSLSEAPSAFNALDSLLKRIRLECGK